MLRTVICGLAAAAVVAAPAKANCWHHQEVAAAKVRDLDTMLMVASLRCRREDPGHVARYNGFVTRHRAPLTAANETLRARFARLHGKAAALNAYDKYITRVANRYGAGVDGLKCSDFASITAAADAEAPAFVALHAIAERAGTQPLLDGGHCAVTVAARH